MFEKYAAELIDAIDIQFILAGCGRILLILLFWWIATKAARRLLVVLQNRLLKREEMSTEPATEKQKRIATLVMLVRQGTFILITVTTLLLGLKQLGIDIAPILASAGVVGLAVGFGAQNLVRNC